MNSIVINEDDAVYLCKLVIVLKRLELFDEKDDIDFWNKLTEKLKRFT